MSTDARGMIVATNLSKSYDVKTPTGVEQRVALDDLSLTLNEGQVYGIIGPKGAGKTTLLKILARMLPPTSGNVVGRGRVVGVFDDDWLLDDWLTGVENVYAQGKLFGWSRAEMHEKLPRISKFGDLQDFMHEKVSTYSPGMKLRLTMAIAFSLRPQLLVLDDVLGVGDDAFIHRCVRRIRRAAFHGATVIFATRDLSQISYLCHRVLWLDSGRVHMFGKPIGVIPQFNATAMRTKTTLGSASKSAFGSIQAVRVFDGDMKPIKIVSNHSDVILQIAYKARVPAESVSFAINAVSGDRIAFSSEGAFETPGEKGRMWAAVRIPAALLARQTYRIDVEVIAAAKTKRSKMAIKGAVEFSVLTRSTSPNERRLIYSGALSRMSFNWRTPDAPAEADATPVAAAAERS